ncbi:MAG TPA: TraR/DksA C4-type zinc finger protein [Lacisediminihabitans sp.]|uniref:TraR/DksA family transcriptional regulator n=1 Tax=Lacisediminihabitans sp. TaxID=2787631 RepID=UPI002ED8B52A
MSLNEEELAGFASLLRVRRAELARDRTAIADELDLVRTARGESSSDDEHDPEGSTLTSDWSRIVGLGESVTERIRAVDAALQRIADGTYGVCVRCGKPIGGERLSARPAAATCIDCARELDG